MKNLHNSPYKSMPYPEFLVAPSADLCQEDIFKKYVVPNNVPDFIPWSYKEACFQSGYDATKRMIEADKTIIDAILYLSDFFMLGGAKYLLENGFEIGKDILIAGFNYADPVKYSHLPFSSAEHDIAALSKEITDNIFSTGPIKKKVKTILHIR